MTMHTETALRDALTAGAETVDVTGDVWQGFTRRERKHRRRRQARWAGVAAAVVAATGVQTGVVPLPGWLPGITVAGRGGPLTTAPTRGNLAADTAFLAGMRQAVTDVVDPGEVWRVADRSAITFPYAADLPGRRLVLASVPLRFGFLDDRALIWYEGEPGAAPDQMMEGGRSDGAEPVATDLRGSGDEAGQLVVVAPPGSTVEVSVGFSYTPAGRVEHAPSRTFTGGLAEMRLEPAPFNPGVTVTVRQDDEILHQGGAGGGWSSSQSSSGTDPHEPDAATLTTALRGRTFDRDLLKQWVSHAFVDARLEARDVPVRVWWTGTIDGQPATLFTLHPAGGGVLAYALHGTTDSYRQDLRLLLPAAGADRRPIAWRMRAEGKDDATSRVYVVAPPGVPGRLTLTAGGAPVTLTPDATGVATTTVAPDTAASVILHPADGKTPASTPVPQLETNMGGIPGADLNTRVVD
jgi:hypothetical protein